MANWITVSQEADIPLNTYQTFDWNGLSLLIINQQGKFYAIENRCPHEDQTLDGGELEGDEFLCPWHGARFCIKTGNATRPPAYENIKTFPIRLVNGVIQVSID
jgi:3-phenylpropionate/trans-cinnamate dioxygenase ferredoxin component